MFKGLKNRIREETGSDVSKITPALSGGSQKSGPFKGQHSRQGSTSSVGSSLDGVREDLSVSPLPQDVTEGVIDNCRLEKVEDEWKKRLIKIEHEWKKKLEEKEKEWRKQAELKDKEKQVLEKSKKELQETLAKMEELKQKYYHFQEEKEQIEGFQSQEMAKVKHLLLAKEREVTEVQNLLKESNLQISILRTEVNKLRHFEEEVSNVQDKMESLRHSSEQEQSTLRRELAQSEENVRHLKDRVAVLERRTSADCVALGAPLSVDERIQGLLGERALLERRLEEAHLHLADIKSSWSSKINALETQVERLCRQAAEETAERRRAEEECSQLQDRIQQLEVELANVVEIVSERDRLRQQNEQLCLDLEKASQKKEEECEHLSETQKVLEEKVQHLTKVLGSERTSFAVLKESSDAEIRTLQEELAENQRSGTANCKDLHNQVQQLRLQLEAERVKCAEMLIALDKERQERDTTLIRNAEVSQQVELSKQQLRVQEAEMADLQSRLEFMERAVQSKDEELDKGKKLQEAVSCREQDLRECVTDLEAQLLEKNKSIKQLQQRLGDMKKTLQRELKLPPGSFGKESAVGSCSGPGTDDTTAAVLTPSASHQVSQRILLHQQTESHSDYNSVNFQYLKHVLIKFLTSREYEAKHMTRAVATLLHFSPEEERLLHETLDWKMSWFGSRPFLGFGQATKSVPPS